MRILLDGYIDYNFGDDLMLTLAADGLREYELYMRDERLAKLSGVKYTEENSDFDWYVKVIGSGFLIHKNSGIPYRMREINREKKYAPKRAVINCNISPFINKAAEKLIQMQLGMYDFVTVRDEYSYDYMKKNLPDVSCEYYPDLVFSLPKKLIPKTEKTTGIGIAIHHSADYAKIAELINRLSEKTKEKCRVLCFDVGSENDVSDIVKLIENIKSKDKFELNPYTTVENMLEEIAECKVILGMRLHSIVAAAAMNIPFVPMAYSDKADNVLKSIGYSGKVFRTDDYDMDAVVDAVMKADKHEIGEDIRKKAQMHIESLKSYILRTNKQF